MILDTPSRSLQIALGEAQASTPCDVTACYAAQTNAGGFLTSLAHAHSTGTAAITIVPAPAPGTQYLVNECRLHNNDSVQHTVSLLLLDGAASFVVYSGSVAAGGDWVYTPGAGTGGSVSGGGGAGEWTAGPVASLGAGLALAGGILSAPDASLTSAAWLLTRTMVWFSHDS